MDVFSPSCSTAVVFLFCLLCKWHQIPDECFQKAEPVDGSIMKTTEKCFVFKLSCNKYNIILNI